MPFTAIKKQDVLDPEDPAVYLDADKVRRLDPVDQMIAKINLAIAGKGDEVSILEGQLAAFGYDMVLDGQLSSAELAALDHFKRQLKDEGFKETALELLQTFSNLIPANANQPNDTTLEAEMPVRNQTIVSDPF